MGRSRFVLYCLALCGAVPTLAQTPTPPPLVIQTAETRWTDVFCDLLEVSRPNPGELMVRMRYRNLGKERMVFPHGSTAMRYTEVIDPVNRVVYGPLMDSEKKIIGSMTIDESTMSGRALAAGASVMHYVKMTAPPESVTVVSIAAPGAVVFDDVTIGAKPAEKPRTTARPVIASQEHETEGVVVEVLDARRTAAGVMTIVYRYRNSGSQRFSFPGLNNQVERAYVIHPGGNTKYTVITTKSRDALAGTTLALGETSGARIEPGQTLTTWGKFPAPPESAKEITFVVPGAVPFEKLPLAGAFSGSGPGAAVSGRAIGLDAALKDLNARVTDTDIRIDLAADVLFDFDKADLKPEAQPALQNVATVINANAGARISIDGHTDGKGTDAYNQPLSEKRAAAVKAWLVTNAKVEGASITTRGLGKSKPLAQNTKPDGSDDPEGRAKNRRVEIVVTKTTKSER